MHKYLIEQRNTAVEKMENILNTAKAENRALTAEEQGAFENLQAEIANIDKTIEMEEAMTKYEPMTQKPSATEPVDQAALDIKNFAGYIRATAGMQNGTDVNLTKGDNGAVIPVTIAQKIIDKVAEICPIYAMATKYNVKGALHIPVVDTTNDITAAYGTEFTDLDSTSAKLASIDLTGYLYGALTKVSKSLLNNTDLNLTNWVVERMALKIAQFVENELLNGTASKVSGIARSYDSTGMKVTLGKKSSVTADELIDLQEKVPDAFQAGACWIMSKNTRTKIRKLKDGEGNFLLQRDFANPANYVLLGKPVYLSDNAPELGTAGNLAIMYGDFSGLAVKETETPEIQILTEKYATQHAIGIVCWGELDAKVENKQKIACAACGSAD